MNEERGKREPVELVQVATSTAPAYSLPDGRTVSIEEYLVWLGNLVWNIKVALG